MFPISVLVQWLQTPSVIYQLPILPGHGTRAKLLAAVIHYPVLEGILSKNSASCSCALSDVLCSIQRYTMRKVGLPVPRPVASRHAMVGLR